MKQILAALVEAPVQKSTDKEQLKKNLLASKPFAMGAVQALYHLSGAGSLSS